MLRHWLFLFLLRPVIFEAAKRFVDFCSKAIILNIFYFKCNGSLMYFAFIFQFIGILNVNHSPEFRCEQVTVSVVNTAKKMNIIKYS